MNEHATVLYTPLCYGTIKFVLTTCPCSLHPPGVLTTRMKILSQSRMDGYQYALMRYEGGVVCTWRMAVLFKWALTQWMPSLHPSPTACTPVGSVVVRLCRY
jgi:hypothetical protein